MDLVANYERARLAAIAVVNVEEGVPGDLANLRNELANAVQAIAGDDVLSRDIKDYMDGNIPLRRDGGDQREIWERLSNNSKALVTNTLDQHAQVNNGGRRKRRRRTRSNSRRLRGGRRSRTSSKKRSYKRRCSHKRCYRNRRCSLRRRSRRRR